jgi:uncharacterized protein (DUF952 family)
VAVHDIWKAKPTTPLNRDEAFPHIYGSLPMSAVVGVYEVDGATSLNDVLPK